VRLLGTGVELRLEDEDEAPLRDPHGSPRADDRQAQRVGAQTFVEVEDGQRREKWPGATGFYDLPSDDEDLTNGLLMIAHTERDLNLGGLLGDLRREGHDITRWEVYSLPFRIELTPRLRARLAGAWRERDPRPGDEAIILKFARPPFGA
jgi:hypothetical protein